MPVLSTGPSKCSTAKYRLKADFRQLFSKDPCKCLTCTQGPRGHTGPHQREDGPKALMCDVLSTDGDNPLSPITLQVILYRIVSNYSIIIFYSVLSSSFPYPQRT